MGNDYPFVFQTLSLAGRSWTLSCVTDQDALLTSLQADDDLANSPFGLMLWASAEVLATRLTQEPSLVAGKRVLELGAGVGFVGLVATQLGAAEVVQTDYHPEALALCRSNAMLNGIVNTTIQKGDWRSWPSALTGFDLVVAAESAKPTAGSFKPKHAA